MGNWTGPTGDPAAAFTTTSAPVTAIAASGATWRQTSPEAAATASRGARTPTGRYGGSGVMDRTHTTDPTPSAPASHTSARTGAHRRPLARWRSVRVGDNTSHRASGFRRDATPAGV